MGQSHRAIWEIKDAIQATAKTGDVDAVRKLIAEGEASSAAQDITFKWMAHALEWAAGFGRVEIVQGLLSDGANVNDQSRGDATSLMWAARNGHREVAEIFLDAGTDVNATNECGTTALMRAARSGDRETVKLLLDRGANVNTKEKYIGSSTALMHAAGCGDEPIVRLLLERGADANAMNNDGEKASDLTGNESILALLKEAEEKQATTLACAVMDSYVEEKGDMQPVRM
ncbi:MAG: ankyrin repeat domain-containing protein [bacterium]